MLYLAPAIGEDAHNRSLVGVLASRSDEKWSWSDMHHFLSILTLIIAVNTKICVFFLISPKYMPSVLCGVIA